MTRRIKTKKQKRRQTVTRKNKRNKRRSNKVSQKVLSGAGLGSELSSFVSWMRDKPAYTVNTSATPTSYVNVNLEKPGVITPNQCAYMNKTNPGSCSLNNTNNNTTRRNSITSSISSNSLKSINSTNNTQSPLQEPKGYLPSFMRKPTLQEIAKDVNNSECNRFINDEATKNSCKRDKIGKMCLKYYKDDYNPNVLNQCYRESMRLGGIQ